MAVIAVYSVKGGVGKTTLAANLAWCSASAGMHRTLLWGILAVITAQCALIIWEFTAYR